MSHYALQAIRAHQRALSPCDPDLRSLLEDERSLWLELDSQSRMLDMLARSMRRAQGEAQKAGDQSRQSGSGRGRAGTDEPGSESPGGPCSTSPPGHAPARPPGAGTE